MQAPRSNSFRDTWAGALDGSRVGETVRVAGWVHRRRDHGGLIFVDLRDRTGIVQLVFDPEDAAEPHALAERLRSEHVVSVSGAVVRREEGRENPNLVTGEIEVAVAAADLLAEAQTPPFPLDEETEVDEALRLEHRALDLRRPALQRALEVRHTIVQAMRSVLDDRGFLEIETPILTRSTPEGARDYLVPARVEPGAFYALPQSPQLFKQLLMIAGYERYYQIARCFRDEDSRADRQPEFTQLDLEMSFVDEDDVIEVMEAVMGRVFTATGFGAPPPPWPRMPWDEAMLRYGSDRPDLRFGLEISDLSEVFSRSDFKVFSAVLSGEGVVRGLNAGAVSVPRSELDAMTEVAKRFGAKGLVWGFVEEDGSWRSPVAKFLGEEEIAGLLGALDASPGDLLLVVADVPDVAAAALGALRLRLRDRFDLTAGKESALVWIVDFPMFEPGDSGRFGAVHHPFTAPVGDLSDPGSLKSRSYDLALDGNEIGGGSIRIHRPEVQQRIFEILGMSDEEAEARFGFLLRALRFGAPPHGGIAMGLDRVSALVADRPNIREVIAFPKTTTGADPLTGAPAPVDEAQLRELGVRVLPRAQRS